MFDTIDIQKDGVLHLEELCQTLEALGFAVRFLKTNHNYTLAYRLRRFFWRVLFFGLGVVFWQAGGQAGLGQHVPANGLGQE